MISIVLYSVVTNGQATPERNMVPIL